MLSSLHASFPSFASARTACAGLAMLALSALPSGATSPVVHATESAAKPVPAASARPGAEAPDFTLTDAKGEAKTLSSYRGKWVVLEWVNYDCPFVKKHYKSGNMQKLQKELKAKGVVWLSINSSAAGKQGHFEGTELVSRIASAKAEPDAYLLDTDGKVGRIYKAKTTPHMFVIDPTGKLAYAGAIDDHPSTEAADIPKSKNYVVAALEAGMAGKKVETTSTNSYGCGVKYTD